MLKGFKIMKKHKGKVHFIHPTINKEDYKDNQHIINAIISKNWAFCNGYREKITNNKNEVTCKACLKLMDELL